MKLYYDLHIHSCLSPCGDMDMTPNNIVNMSVLKGLDVIAVSDHSCGLNIRAVMETAMQTDLLVIPAIEVTTSEEIHVLTLFYNIESAEAFSDYLYRHLPDVKNSPDIFGNQTICDSMDNVKGVVDKLLINATDISIDKLCSIAPDYGAFLIPAHIDKTSYSIISSLGFIPDEYNFNCVEVKNPPCDASKGKFVITNSDAHYLEDISEPERYIEVQKKTIKAVIDALKYR